MVDTTSPTPLHRTCWTVSSDACGCRASAPRISTRFAIAEGSISKIFPASTSSSMVSNTRARLSRRVRRSIYMYAGGKHNGDSGRGRTGRREGRQRKNRQRMGGGMGRGRDRGQGAGQGAGQGTGTGAMDGQGGNGWGRGQRMEEREEEGAYVSRLAGVKRERWRSRQACGRATQ